MPRLPFGRILLLIPTALLSVIASAVDVNLVSKGKTATIADLGGGQFSLCAEQTTFSTQTTAPILKPFTNSCFGLTRIGSKNEAMLFYRDEPQNQTLNLTLIVLNYRTANGVTTITGTWQYIGGTGDYDNRGGDGSKGTWTFTWNMANGATQLDLRGTLLPRNPEPSNDPANFAGLALGTPVLLRRRR